MEFNLNSSFLYAVATAVIVFVLAQSVFFLVRAVRRARAMGMEAVMVRRVMRSSAVFTIAPAISILLGVVSLSKFLGLPLPWVRLSVLGAITYELTAAASAASSAGIAITEAITDPRMYTTIAWVMTIGIIPSTILLPLFLKKIQGGLSRVKEQDSHWGSLLITALFLGMISAFLGMVFAGVTSGIRGWIPVFVLLFSACVMAVCGILVKRHHWRWLEDYALPFSIIGGMAFAVWVTGIIG